MGEVFLVGVPNCGKSAVFSRLTGVRAKSANFNGVTVGLKRARLAGEKEIVLADTPGVLTLSPTSGEERVTRDALVSAGKPRVVQVLDATALTRSLRLTKQLSGAVGGLILAVNRCDLVPGGVDGETVSRMTGLPVVTVSAKSGAGFAELAGAIRDFPTGAAQDFDPAEVARAAEKRGTPRGKWEKRLTSGVSGGLFFALAVSLVMTLTSAAFSLFAGAFEGLSALVIPLVARGLSLVGCPALLSVAVSEGAVGGVFTALSFLFPLFVFYLLTALLEDSGYLARMAMLADPVLAPLGLTGNLLFPWVLALGCGVNGVSSCRTLSARERRVCAGVVTWIPCHAKLPILAFIAGAAGLSFPAVFALFLLPVLASVLASAVRLRGQGGFLVELPRMCIPSARVVIPDALRRAREFVLRAGTFIGLSCLALSLLSHTAPGFRYTGDVTESLLARAGMRAYPFFAPLGFSSWQAVCATFAGFLAKENAVVTLTVLGGNPGGVAASAAFCVFQLFSPPCVAAMGAMRRELGWRVIPALLFQILTACFFAAVVYRFLSLF